MADWMPWERRALWPYSSRYAVNEHICSNTKSNSYVGLLDSIH